MGFPAICGISKAIGTMGNWLSASLLKQEGQTTRIPEIIPKISRIVLDFLVLSKFLHIAKILY